MQSRGLNFVSRMQSRGLNFVSRVLAIFVIILHIMEIQLMMMQAARFSALYINGVESLLSCLLQLCTKSGRSTLICKKSFSNVSIQSISTGILLLRLTTFRHFCISFTWTEIAALLGVSQMTFQR